MTFEMYCIYCKLYTQSVSCCVSAHHGSKSDVENMFLRKLGSKTYTTLLGWENDIWKQ